MVLLSVPSNTCSRLYDMYRHFEAWSRQRSPTGDGDVLFFGTIDAPRQIATSPKGCMGLWSGPCRF